MNEAQFTEQVIDLAHTLGWHVAHFHQSQIRPGVWVTPVKADGKGWPDLVLVRDRLVVAELKNDSKSNSRVTPEQQKWIGLLMTAGVEVYVWRPRDLDVIHDVLSRR